MKAVVKEEEEEERSTWEESENRDSDQIANYQQKIRKYQQKDRRNLEAKDF